MAKDNPYITNIMIDDTEGKEEKEEERKETEEVEEDFVPFLLIDRYNENVIASYTCGICRNFRDHPMFLSSNHSTCICLLLSQRAICCKNGLKGLYTRIPNLALHAPLPDKYTSQYFKAMRSGILRQSLSTIKEIQLFAQNKISEVSYLLLHTKENLFIQISE